MARLALHRATARLLAAWAMAKCGSTTAGQVSHYYVDGGFVQVADNIVSVLTNRAVPAAGLDPKVAEENLAAARNRPAHNDEMLAIRERLQTQARAQLRVAKHKH